MKKYNTLSLLLFTFFCSYAQSDNNIERDIIDIEEKVVEWRHDVHQNPELSNREFKTAKKIAAHLKKLGIDIQIGIAKTGVVGILEGNKPGKVVALRADMDGLPVTERVELPYKSKVVSEYNGKNTGVMHACGHDTHVAILMGVAEVLSKNKDFSGTVKFIFQPAEEGPPVGEEGGANLMIKEGVLENPKVDAIFGLHISSGLHVGKIRYKPGGTMAAAQRFEIQVEGKQAHGSRPWKSIDPIVVSADIISNLQTIISRETELTKEGAVISVGMISSGIRNNIIPEEATLIGTIRTLDYDMQKHINKRMEEMIPAIAKVHRAKATIQIDKGIPITYNDEILTAKMLPTLQRTLGKENIILSEAITGAEDFSFFQKEIPGFYFFLGGTPLSLPEHDAPSHHTPDFFVEDDSLIHGVRVMTNLTLDYLNM